MSPKRGGDSLMPRRRIEAARKPGVYQSEA